MLNQSFNPKPTMPVGPRQQGQPVTDPKMLMAIAMRNKMSADQMMTSPLAQAIARKKKKR